MPAVSVIIGTYNCAKFLPGLFACLHAQTYRDFEIIVVDDASTDGETIPYLEAMGDSIRLIRRETNSSTCELPRYQGVKAATTTWCAFLDADDRWDPTFLEKAMAHLASHPDDVMVHSYVRVVDGEDRVLHIRHEGRMPVGDELAKALTEHCFVTVGATVVRREVWLAAVPEEAITDFGMDQDFFLAIAKRHSVGFIPEVLASYRRSSSSVSVKKWNRVPRNVNTLERLWRNRAWEGVVSRPAMRNALRVAYAENAEHWRHEGYPSRALWFAWRGLCRHGFDGALSKSLVRAAWQRITP